MVLLSGQVSVSGGEQPTELRAGDSLIVPAHTLHRIDNTGPVDAEWLIISVAGVQFFREDGAQARPGWLK